MFSILLVGTLAAILVVLALLQIHWSNQVSQADRERLQTGLHSAVSRFRRDFDRELLRVCWTFDVDSGELSLKGLQGYADRYQDWTEESLRPDLVSGVFVWRANAPPGHRLLHLSAKKGRFLPAPWTAELLGARARLHTELAAGDSASRAAALSGVWILDESAPSLVRSLFVGAAPGRAGSAAVPHFSGAVIIELNAHYIERVIFPTLAQRYFGGPEDFVYRVSIIQGENPERTLYQSSAAGSRSAAGASDAVEDLIPNRAVVPPWAEFEVSPQEIPLPAARRFPPRLMAASGVPEWRLIARHRSGSVEAAVLRLRRRTLTVSLGVLLLLALSMALVIVSTQRARRLARLQIGLVANVSHDLRTPLAVIRSAAENLADGVVEGAQEVKEYGALIRREDRKLSGMVEQILAFAVEASRHHSSYQASPLDVGAALESAVASTLPLVESAGARIEKHIDPELPHVRADATVFARCLQNLISNAVKYGGESPWIGVRAHAARTAGGREVQIQVEDHGIGIDPEDLPYVFEPFYRGRSGHATQIEGTGLGLSLAREAAEAMNGRLTVKSAVGRGSCFTLHLPATRRAEATESPSSPAAEAASMTALKAAPERD